MTAGHYDELINSLKRLYLKPEFSDLNIVSTYKTYPVHKAVVCPRSPYLAEKCRDLAVTGSGNTIEVPEDDPQAVHLVIEYLYNLDYSDTLPEDLLEVKSPECPENESTLGGFSVESPVVLSNGFDHGPEAAAAAEIQPPEDPPAVRALSPQQADTESSQPAAAGEPLDDFLPIKETPKKKKKGKKGRKLGLLDDPPRGPDDVAPPPAQADSPEPPIEAVPEPAPAAEDTTQPAAPTTTTTPQQQQQQQQKLTTHAKLYSLSAKYGISELRALALTKFEAEAHNGWDAGDFVRAAGEVYSSPLLGQENHKDIRRAVTGLVYSHGELLEVGEMQDILRGELALDLIRRLREEGVW
ncbi:hypothetical protein QBC47DRAFT_409716 [Echria macrotheca]|uniref:BTB domain-containing protein n=1 Tax=Echria macrotheca TaxID=438768 RepID=A0AAJ0BL71_9PEZI|nr:hypothetical protein QBC47DRAFT_409716 [Echria macrotheca]